MNKTNLQILDKTLLLLHKIYNHTHTNDYLKDFMQLEIRRIYKKDIASEIMSKEVKK